MFLQVNSGNPSTIFSNRVDGEQYLIIAPLIGSSISTLTYDGADGSNNLDTSGLFSSTMNNWRENCGSALRTSISTDVSGTSVTFKVYSGSLAAVCTSTVTLTDSSDPVIFTLDFDADWSGSCDFSNVGALEITFDGANFTDIQVQYISIYASPVPSSTPSPSSTFKSTSSASPSPASPLTSTESESSSSSSASSQLIVLLPLFSFFVFALI